jgi:hypothetical protein
VYRNLLRRLDQRMHMGSGTSAATTLRQGKYQASSVMREITRAGREDGGKEEEEGVGENESESGTRGGKLAGGRKVAVRPGSRGGGASRRPRSGRRRRRRQAAAQATQLGARGAGVLAAERRKRNAAMKHLSPDDVRRNEETERKAARATRLLSRAKTVHETRQHMLETEEQYRAEKHEQWNSEQCKEVREATFERGQMMVARYRRESRGGPGVKEIKEHIKSSSGADQLLLRLGSMLNQDTSAGIQHKRVLLVGMELCVACGAPTPRVSVARTMVQCVACNHSWWSSDVNMLRQVVVGQDGPEEGGGGEEGGGEGNAAATGEYGAPEVVAFGGAWKLSRAEEDASNRTNTASTTRNTTRAVVPNRDGIGAGASSPVAIASDAPPTKFTLHHSGSYTSLESFGDADNTSPGRGGERGRRYKDAERRGGGAARAGSKVGSKVGSRAGSGSPTMLVSPSGWNDRNDAEQEEPPYWIRCRVPPRPPSDSPANSLRPRASSMASTATSGGGRSDHRRPSQPRGDSRKSGNPLRTGGRRGRYARRESSLRGDDDSDDGSWGDSRKKKAAAPARRAKALVPGRTAAPEHDWMASTFSAQLMRHWPVAVTSKMSHRVERSIREHMLTKVTSPRRDGEDHEDAG